MKPMKVAAVVAGSMMALGAATPAFAADVQSPMSLNGAVDTLASDGLRSGSPVNTNVLDPQNEGSLVNAVKGTADGLNKSKGNKLLGGLPLGK
jgi:opacity protein-like surface antigen